MSKNDLEIERKFLVANNSWRQESFVDVIDIKQFYLTDRPGRIRLCVHKDGRKTAWHTIKYKIDNQHCINSAVIRQEIENEIDYDDALKELEKASRFIHKTRHLIDVEGHIFEVDEFQNLSFDLVLAEIELTSVEQTHPMPHWLALDVSSDESYSNSNLVKKTITKTSAIKI